MGNENRKERGRRLAGRRNLKESKGGAEGKNKEYEMEKNERKRGKEVEKGKEGGRKERKKKKGS